MKKRQTQKEVKTRQPYATYVNSSGITIEKGIPVPEIDEYGRREKYPLTTLEVGDSFFVPVQDKQRAMNLRSILRSKATDYNKKLRRTRKVGQHLKTFIVLIQEEKGQLGVRCWRTK